MAAMLAPPLLSAVACVATAVALGVQIGRERLDFSTGLLGASVIANFLVVVSALR